MNCEDFASIVSELADGKPMDATARVTGLAHAAMCGGCAARLNDAKDVSTGLQTATTAEIEETPARVRESLLAAFAEHHSKDSKLTASPLMLTPASQRSSRRTVGWWSAAAVAIAAMIVLALMLPSLVRIFAPAPPPQSVAVKETQAQPTGTKKPEAITTPEPKKQTPVAENNLPNEPPQRKSAGSRSTGSLAVVRKPKQHNRNIKGEIETVAKNTGNQYIPLTYLASATEMESGTVVRIQVSRSKLISLGLPMNGERGNDLVKADLVLGDDGVARAIRLVE
jgi:hypothetical protein